MKQNSRLTRAAVHLDAVAIGDDEWAHYDDGTQRWHVVDSSDLESLCDYLDSADHAISSDAYSSWCAATISEQMPRGWQPTYLGGAL